MNIQDILISSIQQGMDCPRQDGILDLYLINRSNKMILTCSECEATCDAPTAKGLDSVEPYKASDLFPDVLGVHTQLIGYAQILEMSETEIFNDMTRVLNHRLFLDSGQEFQSLIIEAWNLKDSLPLFGNGFSRCSVEMGRPVGINGETVIYMEYSTMLDRIYDARPIFSTGGS